MDLTLSPTGPVKIMRGLILILLLLLARVASAAVYSPDPANTGDWEPGVDVGVVGGIDQYRDGGASARGAAGGNATIDVTLPPYNADNTGTNNVSTAIKSAIDAASPGDVVYLPAGTYRVTSSISIDQDDSEITIRGAGPGQTIIVGEVAGGVGTVFATTSSLPYGSSAQTVTGTKTKGTSTLTVSDASAYTAGKQLTVFVANEEDNTRIQAGAYPTWSQAGYRDVRSYVGKLVSKTATTLTIDPPLPWDCTNYAVRTERHVLDRVISKVGIEDLEFQFHATTKNLYFVNMNGFDECWLYNVHCPDWTRNNSNGSMLNFTCGHRGEMRKCLVTASDNSLYSDDGAVQWGLSSSCLFEDNIIINFDVGFYGQGSSVNHVFAYNYVIANKPFLPAHTGQGALSLFEGNVGDGFLQYDAYHYSASNNVIFRNWLGLQVALGRFVRGTEIIGNVLGEDGVLSGSVSYGNPNSGNGFADSFAGPSGLSDQEGETDYAQPGYGFGSGSTDTYVIQSSDISAGDFWQDWGMTGTLTTRTSDTAGVVTVSGGDWDATTASSQRLISLWWGGYASSVVFATMTGVSGLEISFTKSGIVLPAQGTTFDLVNSGTFGFQERDLDVAVYTDERHNYKSDATGTGALTNTMAPDTLPDSLTYTAQPSWWTDDGFAGTWPPVDPDSPTFDGSIIPAGARYLGLAAGGTATVNTVTADTIIIGP